jgi:hypothetical protein
VSMRLPTPTIIKCFIMPFFWGLLAFPAYSSCINLTEDSRLRTHCVSATFESMRLGLDDAKFLDALLKNEGYADGLGLPTKVDRTSFQPSLTLLFDYDRNINAGNPDRPLVLGDFQFTVNEENIRISGVVAGVLAGVSGRHIVGEGRYIDYAVGASYVFSPQHDIGIGTSLANICSRNHVAKDFYIDGCAAGSLQQRALARKSQSAVKIGATKLFSSSKSVHHSATISIIRYAEANNYQQKQLQMEISTARAKSFFSSVNVSLGEALPGTLAMRQRFSTSLGAELFGKPIIFEMGYSYLDGGNLLGFHRIDSKKYAQINYKISPIFTVSLGYLDNKSNIDYFSEAEPTVGIKFTPIRF